MGLLFDLAYFGLDVLAILLLVATWQRSRITGFLVLAASYALGILGRWGVSLGFRLLDGDQATALGWISSLTWLVVSAVALYGLWDVYRNMPRAPAAAAPAA